ncbi:hypothetical protein FC093_06220 [Ilyomonas limi]|uniref:Delta-aminolevulinic acid dehydratase n=1 Tax=Ilyomonas limi TaxID=2575867 RepID=A0A4U3L5A2_9BACT|nr:hypothetical protein [Ilyomonas limi]TKK70338.1 hypothetical protein FC093_06220 [Ilyomonas limi]
MNTDLSTYDPYDFWKTRLGATIKHRFYDGSLVIKGIAGIASCADIFLNNSLRIGYNKQEYAIVRALAAMILDRLYQISGKEIFLEYADLHINWLLKNNLRGAHGIGWGLNFTHPVTKAVVYPKATPFTTITPYVLEALIMHEKVTNQRGIYQDVCKSIYDFFDKDIHVLAQNEEFEATSYGPYKDRKVVNSVSYTMYALILLDEYFDYSLNTLKRVTRLFNYIKNQQQPDGSWFYSEEGEPFIDCFHSCIVLKNLIKSENYNLDLPGIESVIHKGYSYLKLNLWDEKKGMYKRFSVQNKPGLIKFDLYDNSEMLQCAVRVGDIEEAQKIASSINKNFIYKDKIYSSIDVFNNKRNPQMLRWAVLPYLYSLNLLETYEL